MTITGYSLPRSYALPLLLSMAFTLLPSLQLLAAEPPSETLPPLPPPIEDRSTEQYVQAVRGQQAEKLVEELASLEYSIREAAAASLIDLGLDAEAQLRQGLESPDPEVRRRCRLILADCLEADYRNRLAGFAAAVEREEYDELEQYRLPVWQRYREAFGTEPESVKLFLEMQQAEPGLFATAEADGAALGDAVQMRFQQAYQPYYWPGVSRRRQVAFETIAAILFLSSDPDSDLPSAVASSPYWSSIVGQSSFREALQKGERQNIAKQLLGLWIVGPTSLNTLHQKLQMAIQYDVIEGVDLAMAALEDDKTQTAYRGYAAMALGSLGGKEYSRKLAELLKNDTECSRRIRNVNGKQFTDVIQIRDIALAWLIYHTDQKHADFGWDSPTATFEQIEKGNRSSSLSFYNFGFGDEKDRQQALAKWNKWAEQNKLPELPERKHKPVKFVSPVQGFGVVNRINGTPAAADLARLPGLETADRLYVQALSRAADAIAQGENVDASATLGEILADHQDYAFQPDREIPLYRRLKPEAERLLSELNAEGRAAYRLQFGFQAKQELTAALRNGTVEDLRAIGRRYFHTAAGADATYIAAVRLRLQGRPLTAALLLSRIKSLAWDADRFEPALSMQLATCYQASGFREEARRLATEITTRWGDLSQLTTPTGPDTNPTDQATPLLSPEAVSFLKAQVLSLAANQTEDWLLYRGDLRRNAQGHAGGAYLAGDPVAHLIDMQSPGAKEVMELIDNMASTYQEQRQTAIPTMQPLVVGNRLLVRTGSTLQAYSLEADELLWSAPMDDVLRDIVRNPAASLLSGEEADKEVLARGLRRRLWDDHAFGRLASDGDRIYSVETHTLGVEGDMQRLVVRADGRRQLDAGPLRGHNTLAAYDITTGKLLWEIGQPLSQPEPNENGTPPDETPETATPDPLSGLYFLGPPLPLAGDLHVIAMREKETLLLELEPTTGKLLHEMLLERQPTIVNPYARNNIPLWMLDSSEHRCGASPAFAQGVMICRLSLNRYAAVDPASRSVLWRFDPQDTSSTATGNAWMNWQKQLLEQANRNPADHWADATPTIAAGMVLLTPSDRDQLMCLRLRDGKLLWRTDRDDGIYVAGVDQERVIVVGRSSVRAYDLHTGRPLWNGSPVALPPGATPSGIGYFHEQAYYLPLASGEIARLDLASGEFTARSLSTGGIVPGNTIAAADHVITQSPRGVWVLRTLGQRQHDLEQQEESIEKRVALGETLLYQGQIREAMEQLQAALKLDGNNRRATELLAIASLEGLRTNYEAFRDDATDIANATDDPARRFCFLQEQALAREKAGQPLAALDSWLKAVELNHQPDELIYTAAARAVRRDRYLSAQLENLLHSVPHDERHELEAKVTAILDQLSVADRLRYFAWHNTADRHRLALATELLAGEQDQWLHAEWLLRSVIEAQATPADVNSTRAEAVALLAELLLKAKRNDQAARCYQYLNTKLADVVCRNGQTGSELYAALPADSPARKLASSRQFWPVGKTGRKEETTSSGFSYKYLLPTEFASGPLAVQNFVEVDTSGRSLSGVNRFGTDPWSVRLPEASEGWTYSNSIYSHSTGQLFGHMLLAWVGNRVAAVDLLNRTDEPLWTLDTHVAKPPAPGMRRFMPMRLQAQRNFAATSNSSHAPLALLDNCLCFQQERKLLAVDPLTGETLWRIDDVAEYSTLISLGKALLVIGHDTEQAVLYSGSEGRQLGRRDLPAASSQVGWIAGRLIYWQTVATGRELVAYDPLTDQQTFSEIYAEGATATAVAGGELAVLDSKAGLEIWDIAQGKLRLSADCPLPADLQHMIVIPSEDSYSLITCVSGFENSPFANSQAMYGFLEAHGPSYAFERETGRLLWKLDLEDQRIRLHQPVDLPVLIFRNQQYRRVGRSSRTEHVQLVVDRRSGKRLHANDNAKNSHFLYDTKVDLDKGTIVIGSSREKVTLYFKDMPEKEK